jgi:GNAT superfamily N-acetyltransferase
LNTKIPFDNLSFSLLNGDVEVSLFQCREPDLTEFLIEDALENQAARLSVTRIVSYDGQVAGFFTLTNDCIIRKSVSDDDGEEWYPYPHYPALKIARLATHQAFEGRGIGRAMLLLAGVLVEEAVRMKATQSPTTGNVTYRHREGEHDGLVLALAQAVWLARHRRHGKLRSMPKGALGL